MSEMVDRVARAMFMVSQKVFDYPEWDRLHPLHREKLENNARAAIEAMREPTEAMLLVAGEDGWPSDRLAPGDAWKIMIDEAMK